MNRLLIVFLALSATVLACSTPAMTVPPAMTRDPKPVMAEIKPAMTTQTAVQVTAHVTADSLHVRTEPMGLRIGYLYHADTVTLTGSCRSGWAQIRWQDGTAWVRAKYLSDNKCKE
jgi:hypothetical protein